MQPPVVPPGGTHLLIDLYECAAQLDDLALIDMVCTQAALATGATILEKRFHHFGEGCGVTGIIVLAESHISVHSWPENDFAAVDVFVCGKCNADAALPILKKLFQPASFQTIRVQRGHPLSVQPATAT